MSVVEVRTTLWEALAGRAPGVPLGPADPDLWRTVVERINPARARPRLRDGVEVAHLTTVRGVDYVMLRSPDRGESCYLRLSPEEHALATRMDGTRTVAGLVAEFVKISGRLSPDQVTRVVAELAANRMLDELPVDAYAPLRRIRGGSWARRFGRGLLAFAKGRRMVLANVDPLVSVLYRVGGRLLFTRVAAVAMAVVAIVGLGVFGWTWARGAQSAFLIDDSYALGALGLLGLNVVALSSHELGHALAAKHAGRRVPAAGFLLYFGIPSAFVDTTDVWMADRRSRLRTTAAGPAAALTLAGAAQLVGLAYPTLAALCFKLSFAWYLNSLFNLNPLMALDGYYLLMDWLEVPNLRARGIAFLVLTVRRRRPRWSTLDREGRLVAAYGVLALLWLLIAANLGLRVYLDRVAGVVTGLWHRGLAERALVVAIVLGLAAPLAYASAGWLGRRVGRVPEAFRERRRRADLPRRLDTLRASVLADLPTEALTELARTGRWLRPRPGTALIAAGATPRAVYVIADGVLEARAPADAVGSVRERAIAGQVVGAAIVRTGQASAFTWTTVGTRLLALPASRFLALAGAATVGPESGAERAELEHLIDTSPALAAVGGDDRLAVAIGSRPVDLSAGQSIEVEPDGGAALVSAGVLSGPAATEVRRGEVLVAGDEPAVATARTPARLWVLPASLGLTLPSGSAGNHSAPDAGLHPSGGYPPLRPPVGSPPPDDGSTDRRLRRATRWLALLLLLCLLLAIAMNTRAAISWSEMPGDRALLTVTRGHAIATVDATPTRLSEHDQRFIGPGDSVVVERDSLVRLTFHGGGLTVLCPLASISVGQLSIVDGARSATPRGELLLTRGRAIARTATASGAFAPLALRVLDGSRAVANNGAAVFAVSPGGLTVAAGEVTVDGAAHAATGGGLDCGVGLGVGAVIPNVTSTPNLTSTPNVTSTPSLTSTPNVTSTPIVTTTPNVTRTAGTPPTTTTTTPANTPPVIEWVRSDSASLGQTRPRVVCGGGPTTTRITARVLDAQTPGSPLTVTMSYALSGHPEVSGTTVMSPTTRAGPVFQATLGPIAYAAAYASGGILTVTVRAVDPAHASATAKTTTLTLARC